MNVDMLIELKGMTNKASVFELVIDPDSVDVFIFLRQVEGPEAFHRVVFEAAAELVSVGHQQSTEPFLLV